ncbi:MAG: hypothetical protein U0795_01880 [Pirellulales bacterium]
MAAERLLRARVRGQVAVTGGDLPKINDRTALIVAALAGRSQANFPASRGGLYAGRCQIQLTHCR